MYRGEWFNSLTHLVGAIAAAIGLIVLLAAGGGDPVRLTAFAIYGITLVALYTLSTLYHSLRGRKKGVFRRLEHCGIYLLIAGTYTPFALITLRGRWGTLLFVLNWALAVCGIAYEHLVRSERRVLAVVLYVVMGWLVVIAWSPLVEALAPGGVALIVGGGVFYTGGIVFYALEYKRRLYHGIWHLFVLAGSMCHYFAVLWYVA